MEPECLLLSQELRPEPYSQPEKFHQHPYTLFKIHLILSAPRSMWSLHL